MKADITELRQKVDLEKKYVDFATVRNVLGVLTVAEDAGANLNEPNEDGECRADCPKCDKKRSFSLNINTNRFNCFNKPCDLRGSGVIDFFAKLFDVQAKESSHLLACAYGIQPYTAEFSGAGQRFVATNHVETKDQTEPTQEIPIIPEENREVVSSDEYVLRSEYNDLSQKFDRLSNIVFGYMLEHDENCHQNFEDEVYEHLVSH